MCEGLKLTSTDLQHAQHELCTEHASAYMRWDLSAGRQGYLFIQGGKVIRGFESDSKGQCRLYQSEDLWQRISGSVSASTYLVPGRWLSLLSVSCVLPSLHSEQRVAPKEGKSLLAQWEKDKLNGFAILQQGEQRAALAWDEGEMLSHHFVAGYGEFLSGREAISEFVERFELEGGTLWGWGGRASDYEPYLKTLHTQLDQRAHLNPKSVSGFFASKDTLKVDTEISHKWSRSGTFQVQVEDSEGRPLGQAKCTAGSGKGQAVEVPLKMLQAWGTAEGQELCLYPV